MSLSLPSAAPVTIVTGRDAEKIAAAVEDLPVALVHNPDFAQGFPNAVFGQTSLATQFLHGLGQTLCQVIKHYLLRY